MTTREVDHILIVPKDPTRYEPVKVSRTTLDKLLDSVPIARIVADRYLAAWDHYVQV